MWGSSLDRRAGLMAVVLLLVAAPMSASTSLSGTWEGPDVEDGSIVTVDIVQDGSRLTARLSDAFSATESGETIFPGYSGTGTGTVPAETSAVLIVDLDRSDGDSARAELELTLRGSALHVSVTRWNGIAVVPPESWATLQRLEEPEDPRSEDGRTGSVTSEDPCDDLAGWSGEVLSWEAASQYLGSFIVVEGPVVATDFEAETDSTFVYLGDAGSGPGRFALAMAEGCVGDFVEIYGDRPDAHLRGKTVRAFGQVAMLPDGTPGILDLCSMRCLAVLEPQDDLTVELVEGILPPYASGEIPGEVAEDLGLEQTAGVIYWPVSGSSASLGWHVDVANTTAWPYRCAVRVKSTYEINGGYEDGFGSGVLIGPKHVLTAAHNVRDTDNGSFPQEIEVATAYRNGTSPFGLARGMDYDFPQEYLPSSPTGEPNYDHDYAIIELDRPVGALTGWLNLGVAPTSGDPFENWSWRRITFPCMHAGSCSSKHKSDHMTVRTGHFDGATPDQIYVDAETCGCESGSGELNGDTVYAVTSHMKAGGMYSYSVRITSAKAQKIAQWIDADTPSGADLVPLMITVPESTTIVAGKPPEYLWIAIANVGDQTWNAPIPIKIYLSSDYEIDSSDTLIGTYTWTGVLQPRATVWEAIDPPPTIPASTFYTGWKVGAILDVLDATPANNATAPEDVSLIHLSLGPPESFYAYITSFSDTGKATFSLGWEDKSYNVTYYELWERPFGTGAWQVLDTLPPDSKSHTFEAYYTMGTEYCFKVRAVKTIAEPPCDVAAPFSDTVCVIAAGDPPDAPKLTDVVAVSPTLVGVHWQDNSSNEDQFIVERSLHGLAGPGWEVICNTDKNATYCGDILSVPAQPGTYHHYRVRAVNAAGLNSSWSNVLSVEPYKAPPEAPSGLAAWAEHDGIHLQWNSGSTNETGFVIERMTSGGFVTIGSVGTGVDVYVDTTVTSGVTYWYQVRAANPYGQSPPTIDVSATAQ